MVAAMVPRAEAFAVEEPIGSERKKAAQFQLAVPFAGFFEGRQSGNISLGVYRNGRGEGLGAFAVDVGLGSTPP